MRDLQPELKKIKQSSGGNKQKEAMLMMELYKEKGISPFGTIGLTLVQLPIFIGVFQAARYLTENLDKLDQLAYPFVKNIPHIQSVIQNHDNFNYNSLGLIDLSQKAFSNGKVYLPVLIIGVIATILQFYQSRQLLPRPKEKKGLRDLLRSSAQGKQPDQEDMSAAMGGFMLYMMPALTLMFALYAQGAMVVYLLATSAIGWLQQTIIFRQSTEEIEERAEVISVAKKPATERVKASSPTETKTKKSKGVTTTTRIITAGDAKTRPAKTKKSRKKRGRR